MTITSSILTRLGQASTWAGVSGFASLAIASGYVPVPDKPLVAIIGGAAAALAVVIQEGWQKAAASGDAINTLTQRVAELEGAAKPSQPVPAVKTPPAPAA